MTDASAFPRAVPTVDELVNDGLELARQIARRHAGRTGDRDELESEAMYALVLAARRYREGDCHDGIDAGPASYDRDSWRQWARLWIARALRRLLREAPLIRVGMPVRLRRSAVRVATAVTNLAARGIRRPTADQIAGESLVPEETVELVLTIPGVVALQSAVEWAESRAHERAIADPVTVPLFPIVGFDRDSKCPHYGPIADGSTLCCMICHDTGWRKHPALRRTKATEPKAEPRRSPSPQALPASANRETRKQKRRRLFGPALAPPAEAG